MESLDTEGGKGESGGTGNQPKVSIVLLGYNRAHMLPKCIETLKEQDYENIEIIYVDDASIDNSVDVAESYGIKKIIRLPENKGFGPPNNKGVKIAEGDFVFFVHDDMYFEKSCVSELVKEITNDEDIFAVDPLQYNWEGTEIHHGAIKIKKSGLKNWFPFVLVDFDVVDEKIEIPWGCAGSLMVRREMFEELGGFDSTFFLDCEDTDLCVRAWMRGWKTVYVPSAKLYHMVSGGTRTPSDLRMLSGEKNFLRFVLKVMSKKMVVRMYLAKLVQALGLILMGKKRGVLILKAMVRTLSNFNEISEERKKIFLASKESGDEILEKFLAKSQ
ncbi:glycosyltransferase family 2 protein [Halobacteriota archaeon]